MSITNQLAPTILTGNILSSGLAQGLVYVHQHLPGSLEIPARLSRHEIDSELFRLDKAMKSISTDLIALASRVEKQLHPKLAEVFSAHQLMLNDSLLKEELRKEITQNLVNASSAVQTVFLRWERRFLLMESQIAKDKGDDMRDISIRLRNALAGISVHSLDKVPSGCILVTSRLLPSDTIFLAKQSVAAVLLQYGSYGSHAALFAREMEIAAISGFSDLFDAIPDNSWVLVDADIGAVTIRPSADDRIAFDKKVGIKERALAKSRLNARRPAITGDGVAIAVLANVGNRKDAEKAMNNGAEGIGLYRIEHAYLGRITPPDKEELVAEMRDTLQAASGHPVCVRLLDAGADKPLPFLGFRAETNPALGRRGIRLLLEHPELLMTQLAAVLELSREFEIRLLIPMVTIEEDALTVKHLLHQLGMDLKLSSLPPLGAMIETPAAALSAKLIGRHVDFFSFGTNDLAQYTFAADRDNPAVERYFNTTPDVIFRLLQIVHDDTPEVPLSLCGEFAGIPKHIGRLVESGIRNLSVAAPLIPSIKEAIRAHRDPTCS